MLKENYKLIERFQAFVPDEARVYDLQDAFFTPFAHFQGVQRPGPNYSLYKRGDSGTHARSTHLQPLCQNVQNLTLQTHSRYKRFCLQPGPVGRTTKIGRSLDVHVRTSLMSLGTKRRKILSGSVQESKGHSAGSLGRIPVSTEASRYGEY